MNAPPDQPASVERDYWPFTRLVITAFSLGTAAHCLLGWGPTLRQILALPGQIFGVLALLAMVSFVLADLYLLLFLVPLYIVGVLNDWFYLAAARTCQVILRIKPGLALNLSALVGEIVLFGGLALLIRRVLLRL